MTQTGRLNSPPCSLAPSTGPIQAADCVVSIDCEACCSDQRARFSAGMSRSQWHQLSLLQVGSVTRPIDFAAVMAQCSSSSLAAPETAIAHTMLWAASRQSTPPGKGAIAAPAAAPAAPMARSCGIFGPMPSLPFPVRYSLTGNTTYTQARGRAGRRAPSGAHRRKHAPPRSRRSVGGSPSGPVAVRRRRLGSLGRLRAPRPPHWCRWQPDTLPAP